MTNVGEFQWQNRLIVVFARPENASAVVELLAAEAALMADRDILWFVISPQSVSSNAAETPDRALIDDLRRRFQSEPTADLEVVLVGKDGGVKHRSAELDTLDIYLRIDQMPMRLAELEARSQQADD